MKCFLQMNKFYSLKQYLLLKDATDPSRRSIHREEFLPENYNLGKSIAEDLVERYNIAKSSWETHGDEGPMPGSKVQTLYAGHGGSAGLIKTLAGVYLPDQRFFLLRFSEKDNGSLVNRGYWWNLIRVVE